MFIFSNILKKLTTHKLVRFECKIKKLLFLEKRELKKVRYKSLRKTAFKIVVDKGIPWWSS